MHSKVSVSEIPLNHWQKRGVLQCCMWCVAMTNV